MSPPTRYRGSWGRSQFVQQIDAEQSEEAPGGRALGRGWQKRRTQEWGSCVRGLGAGRECVGQPSRISSIPRLYEKVNRTRQKKLSSKSWPVANSAILM